MFGKAHHVTHVGGRSGYNKQGEINFVYWWKSEKKKKRGINTNKVKSEILLQPWLRNQTGTRCLGPNFTGEPDENAAFFWLCTHFIEFNSLCI